jgi:hypothetical protein
MLEVLGNTVTWDHVIANNQGDEFCVTGHSAVIEDGKIISWQWPDGGFDCP